MNKDIKTYQDKITYFQDKINRLINSYKLFLNEDISISESMLYKQNTFNGLLLYIGTNLYIDEDINNINIYDIDLLELYLYMYLLITSKYNHRYTINGYCIMCNINKSELLSLSSSMDNGASLRFSRLLKRLKDNVEQSLLTGSQTFELFLLKSQFGYSDMPMQTVQDEQSIATLPDIYGTFTELLPGQTDTQPK